VLLLEHDVAYLGKDASHIKEIYFRRQYLIR